MSKSKSAEEYASMMEQLGVFVAIFREPKSRRIQQVTLADASLNSILDSEWKNEIRVEDFQKVEDKGAWKKDDAKPRRLSSEEVKEAFGYAKIEGVDLVNDETEEQDVGVNMD